MAIPDEQRSPAMTWQRFAFNKQACRPFASDEADPDFRQPLLDPAPPWRRFMDAEEYQARHASEALQRWHELQKIGNDRARQKAASFYLSPTLKACQDLVLAVNAALALRRPLLVTGLPGSGKTSLAFALADWLGLGPVLEWQVTPGAQLAEALSTYNPLARLQELETRLKLGLPMLPVERFVRLGPVGTAFLPAPLPRVLLIDEIDKGDLNLPNELLHLFEEGRFAIPELQRAEQDDRDDEGNNAQRRGSQSPRSGRGVEIWDECDGQPLKAPIYAGQVQCHEFPLVVMSSNGERDFPPAFNRRCLRVSMPDYSREDRNALRQIVANHLHTASGHDLDGQSIERDVEAALSLYSQTVQARRSQGDALATDQLLNLAFLMDSRLTAESRDRLQSVLLQGLNSDTAGAADDGLADDDDD